MPPKPRSKQSAKTTSAAPDAEPSAPAKTLPPSDANPRKLFILPKDATPDARIVTLSNPATRTPNRYFHCPKHGFYEFTKIAAPKKSPRSWLIADQGVGKNEEGVKKGDSQEESTRSSSSSSGYIAKAADLFIATPFDPLFFLLPVLQPKDAKAKSLFLASDDYLDAMGETSPHMRHLFQTPITRTLLERRMADICDHVSAGQEKMYRINHDKVLAEFLHKAERMIANGLPASMEEKFVRTALQKPVTSVKEETDISRVEAPVEKSGAEPMILADAADVAESQSSAAETSQDSQSSFDSTATASTAATSISIAASSEITLSSPKIPIIDAPEGIPHLLRLRTALTFLTSSYLPPTLRTLITTTLTSSTTPNIPSFAPLNAHLAALATLRAEQAALRSISDNISRKRAHADDDDEVAEARAEKKRRKEEEDKKKRNESRAVKQLKKVDTSGMKKLSSFFTKK
ncbi:hypothetical protein K402DRAFT_396389 [Aulographum hederae CBS 113979]|uniref:Ribonuclease H2 subunit B n=1 Tax=Aulographum hederae CBS 113979 TaxID=1176131 RepID=A0A6G1GS43_9PEZI|nr:hypothetical protein K402DRAFT_396389 [Aulographum hederae CBS 113979]